MLLRDAQDSGSSRLKAGSLVRLVLVGMLVAPSLAACGGSGFRPMYAANSGGQRVSDKMAQVGITTIPSRVGQQLRNELIFRTTGGGQQATDKTYKLDIAMRARVTSQLVDIKGNAETQIYHIDADFQLVDMRNKNVVFKGQSFGRAGYQRFRTSYANVRARRDAENRTARTVRTIFPGELKRFCPDRVVCDAALSD